MAVDETYVTDSEYDTYYGDLNNLRFRIAADLPVRPEAQILDVGTGYGYFAIEIAHSDNSVKVTGVDISSSCVEKARKKIADKGFQDRIRIVQADVTSICFRDEAFNMAVNFTGLEDIHMTRGLEGVQRTFSEVSRVIKSNGCFCFVVMPPEEMETEAQKIEVDIFSYICNATWLSALQYEQMLKKAGMTLTGKSTYFTGKKLTPEQAKVEIQYSCEYAPKIYGVATRRYEDVWSKYGPDIEKYGMGHYSKVVLMIAEKRSGV